MNEMTEKMIWFVVTPKRFKKEIKLATLRGGFS